MPDSETSLKKDSYATEEQALSLLKEKKEVKKEVKNDAGESEFITTFAYKTDRVYIAKKVVIDRLKHQHQKVTAEVQRYKLKLPEGEELFLVKRNLELIRF